MALGLGRHNGTFPTGTKKGRGTQESSLNLKLRSLELCAPVANVGWGGGCVASVHVQWRASAGTPLYQLRGGCRGVVIQCRKEKRVKRKNKGLLDGVIVTNANALF